METWYNENDPKKAAWLRELMKAGIVAQGVVDERSIEEVQPADLGYLRCGFFAGIGIWEYALRLAAWPESEPCWHGSCPCTPFSVAGRRKGQMDKRHLWPAWFRLIAKCRPGVVFGEQVADGDGIAWLDVVQTQMESEGYRFGACVLPAAGFGAPHGRHRIYFVADTQSGRDQRSGFEHSGGTGVSLGDTSNKGLEEQRGQQGIPRSQNGTDQGEATERTGAACDVGHTESGNGSVPIRQEREEGSEPRGAGPVNGFWRDAEWLWCKDGKYRCVEPSTFPLATRAPARILRLRGYGDGICAPVAAEFIKAYMTT